MKKSAPELKFDSLETKVLPGSLLSGPAVPAPPPGPHAVGRAATVATPPAPAASSTLPPPPPKR